MMPSGLTRSLEFKDRFVELLTQAISSGCDASDPIIFPDNETVIKFPVALSLDEFTKLLSAVMTGADLSYPEQSHEVVWLLLRQVECPVSICDELIECLSPLFDGLADQIVNVQSTVNQVIDTLNENAAKPPEPIVETVGDAVCGGATAVVEYMHNQNMEIYNTAEASFVDDLFEYIPVLIEAIPALGALPFDELFELVNQYFENQQVDYEADYNAIKNALICDLKCFILQVNSAEFTYQAWGDWLTYVGETYPGNRAASVFSRYAPAAQTFFNQIAQFVFGGQSLQAYFDELYQVYFAGTQVPVTCVDCDCEMCGFTVQANIDPTATPFGQDSGINVVSGQTYLIEATGVWSYAPGFWEGGAAGNAANISPVNVLPDDPPGCIMWKVGVGGVWQAGDEMFSVSPDASGTLFFAMNDRPGYYGDNTGSLCVVVTPT